MRYQKMEEESFPRLMVAPARAVVCRRDGLPFITVRDTDLLDIHYRDCWICMREGTGEYDLLYP